MFTRLQEFVDFSTGTSRSIPEAAAGAAQLDSETPAWMLDEQQEQQFEEEDDEEDDEYDEPYAQPAAAAARSRRQVGC
jgi:hypothetical protein